MTASHAWDPYYADYPVPQWLINRVWRGFRDQIRRHAPMWPLVVAELGGADSSLAPLFLRDFAVAEYHVFDNNVDGVARFRRRHTYGHEVDLLTDPLPRLQADIVFSAGLIEHFTPEDTARMIAAHAVLVKPGGLILLSFPRPTVPYWVTRTLATWLGRFSADLYERPLARAEVEPVVTRHGALLAYDTIWSTLLTQSLVAVRAR